LAVLAYLMVLVGSVTVVQGNPEAQWKYLVAVMPVVPAGVVIWLTVRALGRLDEVQKRTQMQALGFSVVATGVSTFGYGFLEGVGLPHLNSTYVLPLMAVFWGVGFAALRLRHLFRHYPLESTSSPLCGEVAGEAGRRGRTSFRLGRL